MKVKKSKKDRNRDCAVEIADYLFKTCRGEVAKRLVLETHEGNDEGGWCWSAVVEVILERIKKLK